MSIKAVDWALNQRGISLIAQRVLIELANAINRDDEFCWPSQDRLAATVGKTTRTVQRAIAQLEEAGLVRATRGKGLGRGRGNAPCRYSLACDPATGEARTLPAKSVTTRQNRPVVTDATRHEGRPVSDTTRRPCPLRPVKFVAPLIEEPEKEPETLALTPPAPAKPKRAASGSDLPGFDDLWRAWSAVDEKPSSTRKVGAEAFAAAIKAGHDPRRIVAGAKRYLADAGWQREGGRFMKGVGPFIRQEVWLRLSEPETRVDDGLGMFRTACTYRERSGEWPPGYNAEKIPDAVRSHFPSLFPANSRSAA